MSEFQRREYQCLNTREREEKIIKLASDADYVISEDQAIEIEQVIDSNNMVLLATTVRRVTGLGLQESKNLVDKIKKSL